MPTKQKQAKRRTAAKKTQTKKASAKKTAAQKTATGKPAPWKKLPTSDSARGYPFKVVHSGIHGRGVVATEPIHEGRRLVEYIGERISMKEADRRYPLDESEKNQHTFLFSVSERVIIDAASGGNVARFINHSCDPNCEAVIEKGRVFIEATRAIEAGEELGYDYWFVLDEPHNKKNKELYKCNCGAKNCRGTMLADKRKAREYLD